ADSARDDVRLRMHARLLSGQHTSADHFLHYAVIGREPLQQAAATEVSAAVAGPEAGIAFFMREQGDDGRAANVPWRGAFAEFIVRVLQRRQRRIAERECRTERIDRREALDHALARDIAALMPAHAVRDGPKANSWPIEQCVFIQR